MAIENKRFEIYFSYPYNLALFSGKRGKRMPDTLYLLTLLLLRILSYHCRVVLLFKLSIQTD